MLGRFEEIPQVQKIEDPSLVEFCPIDSGGRECWSDLASLVTGRTYSALGARLRASRVRGQFVAMLSHELTTEFGHGFERTNLTRMMKFTEAFPHEEIVATLSQQLSWSHFRELLPLDKPLQREFYAEMYRMEGWRVRTLRRRIDSMLYERTA
jgi:hypothetical protein